MEMPINTHIITLRDEPGRSRFEIVHAHARSDACATCREG